MGGNGPGEIRVCTRSTCCTRFVPPSVLCQLSDGNQILMKHGNGARSPLLLNDTDSKRAKRLPRDTVKPKAFFKVTENDKTCRE